MKTRVTYKLILAVVFYIFSQKNVYAQCAGNCTLYTVSNISVSLQPNAGTSLVLADDQVSTAVPIGFTFTFMCNSYTNVYICSNGFISFNSAVGSGCCSGQTCPTLGGNPNNYVALAWNDLYPPGGGTIKYQTIGVAPNRIFVVTYSLIPFCCSTTAPFVSGQIQLYETSNRIEVHNASIGNQGNAQTQGIMNAAGTTGVPVPGRNAVVWTATNDAYRFTPSPAIPPCSGTPTPGISAASPTSGCNPFTSTLSLTGGVVSCSLTYQWQSASALAGPYSNIIGANSSTASVTNTITTYYRCIVACSGNTASSAPVTCSVTGVCPACAACSNYSVTNIPLSLSPNTGTSLTLTDDQLSSAIPIGFTFTFMCNAYTNLYISSNGFLSFNSAASSGCCSGQICPTIGGNPNNYVAIFWNDLYPPGGGTIRYQTIGTAPNRVFVVTYSLIPFCCTTTAPFVSGQIKLYETSNSIEVHNASVGNQGNNQTQGIMNASGTIGVPVTGRNSVAWTANNDAYRWTYCPVNPLPMELIYYDVTYTGEYAEITWETATEINTDYFLIEKSVDGINYSYLDKIKANKNSFENKKYRTIDLNPNKNGLTYYKLKQYDNGEIAPKHELVKVINISELNKKTLIQLQPNPSNSTIEVLLPEIFERGDVTFQIFDYSSKKILSIIKQNYSHDEPINIDVRDFLTGMYLLQVFDNNRHVSNITFIKN